MDMQFMGAHIKIKTKKVCVLNISKYGDGIPILSFLLECSRISSKWLKTLKNG